jgi:hypothetical protein
MELNAVNPVTKTERASALSKSTQAGFNPLLGGLGVIAGKYKFITPNSENIFATKGVQSGNGNRYCLTLVAGSLIGAEDHNRTVSQTFGLRPVDKQMVVTVEQWMKIDANQTYDVIVNEKGRISKLDLVSEDSLVQSSEVTESKKKKVFSEL